MLVLVVVGVNSSGGVGVVLVSMVFLVLPLLFSLPRRRMLAAANNSLQPVSEYFQPHLM